MSNIVTKQIKSVALILLSLILLISFSLIFQGTTSRSVNDLDIHSILHIQQPPAVSGSSVSGSAVSGSTVTINGEPVALSASNKKSITIKKLHRIRYATKMIKLHKEVSLKSKVIKKIPENAKIKVIGKVVGKDTYKVSYKGKKGYIKKKTGTLTKKKPFVWNGPKLTKSKGVNAGPSGKETYYNLPMGGVIRILQSHHVKGRYWVRSDGCKMWGKYIMVAADQRIKSRRLGCIVPTSLGLGIVTDTGSFIYSNSRQLDIAVAW